MTDIDLTKLIDVTQELVHNGMIEGASRGEMIVQEIEDDDGNRYKLSVVMTLTKEQ